MTADTELREQLAALAHEQWSGWMRYLFEKTTGNIAGTALIPEWAVERWKRQLNTPYAQLSEEEKESDRKEADRVLALLKLEPLCMNPYHERRGCAGRERECYATVPSVIVDPSLAADTAEFRDQYGRKLLRVENIGPDTPPQIELYNAIQRAEVLKGQLAAERLQRRTQEALKDEAREQLAVAKEKLRRLEASRPEQPAPRPGEGDVMAELEERVRQRRERGLATYGIALQRFNGRDALEDAIDEALDMAAYLLQEQGERDQLQAELAAAIARVKELEKLLQPAEPAPYAENTSAVCKWCGENRPGGHYEWFETMRALSIRAEKAERSSADAYEQNARLCRELLEMRAERDSERKAKEEAQRLVTWLDHFESETKAVPVNAEDETKGASVYNWRIWFVRQARAALRLEGA